MSRIVRNARIPVSLECPSAMEGAIQDVLAGEYESGYAPRPGVALSVLDIGANVGAFAVWAGMRWPGCHVHCYEPHPETYRMLCGNLAGRPQVTAHHAAVYPLRVSSAEFWARFGGDGEAGMVVEARRTFERLESCEIVEVPVVHPSALPSCDVVKLDVEGAEAAILRSMDVTNVSLILLEYQNAENGAEIEELLRDDFDLVHRDSYPWDSLIPGSRYRRELKGDRYGHLFFANRLCNRMIKDPDVRAGNPPQAAELRRISLRNKIRGRLRRIGRRMGELLR